MTGAPLSFAADLVPLLSDLKTTAALPMVSRRPSSWGAHMPSERPGRRVLADRSLRTRLLLPALAGGLAVLAVAAFGYQGQRALTGRTADLLRDSQVLENHLTGDMMHDALRADVLAVLLAAHAAGGRRRAPRSRARGTFLAMQDDNARPRADPALRAARRAAAAALDATWRRPRASAPPRRRTTPARGPGCRTSSARSTPSPPARRP